MVLDGHPDFFAHLARLHFAEDRDLDAWEMMVRGLRRLHERTTRAGEWEDDERGRGVLLQYLHEHLEGRQPPIDVVESLLDLRGLLDGEDQVHLGLCLLAVARRKEARAELTNARDQELPTEARDLCVRALLNLDVTAFERRFARAAEKAMRGSRPAECLADMQLWLQLQPSFWQALFYSAVAKRRLGASDEALDLLAEAERLAPGRGEVLHQMALLFDERGNPKRALELVDRALALEPAGGRLQAARVQFLLRLQRLDEARECLQTALGRDPGDRDLLRLRRQLDG
jgi:tetratricopeptide (TPR) repeat protein